MSDRPGTAVLDGVRPFRVEVDPAVLADLRRRLGTTRLPHAIPGTGWDYGTDKNYLADLLDYWRDHYDWRAAEAGLNRMTQFTTTVDGLHTHFVHERSDRADALPLLITHGWPGSVFEFHKIVDRLTHPENHGGDPADSFHVVCPSLPGYGWSAPPERPGVGAREIAASHALLMRRLGYGRYGLQGGDWGARISAQHALYAPNEVAGVHLNMTGFLPAPREGDGEDTLTEAERADVQAMRAFRADGTGYNLIQSTRPLTLSYGLSDSPAGLAAWIVEKFRAWSDCNGDVESRFTRDELLTNVMIYWVTNTAASAGRLYREGGARQPWSGRVEVPVGIAVFPAEMSRYPRAWVEPYLNVTRWTRMSAGGHFAALEEPDLLVADVRDFFSALR